MSISLVINFTSANNEGNLSLLLLLIIIVVKSWVNCSFARLSTLRRDLALFFAALWVRCEWIVLCRNFFQHIKWSAFIDSSYIKHVPNECLLRPAVEASAAAIKIDERSTWFSWLHARLNLLHEEDEQGNSRFPRDMVVLIARLQIGLFPFIHRFGRKLITEWMPLFTDSLDEREFNKL